MNEPKGTPGSVPSFAPPPIGNVPPDTQVIYSEKEKTVTYTPSSQLGASASSSVPTTSPTVRKAASSRALPEGHYSGEHVVESAVRFYEGISLPDLKAKYKAKFPSENLSHRNKPDVIAAILCKVVLPSWAKNELKAEAEKYGAKKGGNKDQLAEAIVAKLLSNNLIKGRPASSSAPAGASGLAAAAPSSPLPPSVSSSSSSSSTTPTKTAPPSPSPMGAPDSVSSSEGSQFSTCLLPVPQASSSPSQAVMKKVKTEDTGPEDKMRPRKRSRADLPNDKASMGAEGYAAAAATAPPTPAVHFDIDIPALAEQIKRFGTAEPLVASEETLRAEAQLRVEMLTFIEMLLTLGASAPQSMVLLRQQLMPHILREKTNMGDAWVEKHKRTLAKRDLKRKRDQAQERLNLAQAELADLSKQLASLNDA